MQTLGTCAKQRIVFRPPDWWPCFVLCLCGSSCGFRRANFLLSLVVPQLRRKLAVLHEWHFGTHLAARQVFIWFGSNVASPQLSVAEMAPFWRVHCTTAWSAASHAGGQAGGTCKTVGFRFGDSRVQSRKTICALNLMYCCETATPLLASHQPWPCPKFR